jgi:VanZ family protein
MLVRVAWMLAVGYACTDELHQFFVPGRHASWLDIALFDAPGAALGIATRFAIGFRPRRDR